MTVNTLADALKVADIICKSIFCPKQFIGKPGDVLVCLQYGAELGLKPMQAVQNIAVINGKPSIFGDAMLAVCQQSPNWEWMTEEYLEDINGYKCTVKRKGAPEHSAIFTEADAKQAGLWGGSDPWRKYSKRMLQMRARGFALRDTFADCLKGLISAEEAGDYPNKESKLKPKEKEAEAVQVIECISEEQAESLYAKIEVAKADMVALCNYYQIDTLESLPKSSLDKVHAQLDKKIEMAALEARNEASVAEFFQGAE